MMAVNQRGVCFPLMSRLMNKELSLIYTLQPKWEGAHGPFRRRCHPVLGEQVLACPLCRAGRLTGFPAGHPLGAGHLDPGGVKSLLQSSPILPANGKLLQRLGLEPGLDRDR
jgi:hypothetical protein